MRSLILVSVLAFLASACSGPTTEQHKEGFRHVSVSYKASYQSYAFLRNHDDVGSLKGRRWKSERELWMGVPYSDDKGNLRPATVHELEAFVAAYPEDLENLGRVCARGTSIPMRLGIDGRPVYYGHPVVHVVDGEIHRGTTRDLLCGTGLMVER